MDMLLQVVEGNIRNEFPSLKYFMNESNDTLIIKGPNDCIGDIELEDDLDEIIVMVGNFTHWHAACYDQTISKEERDKQVSAEITGFLKDLFTNKLVLWGSHQAGGGFYNIDFDINEQDSPCEPIEVEQYFWSGEKYS
ncbi:Conserved hypothetical protein [Shewanella piezotolerans WP3]|uniref:Uncharacterized protein n=1 Tax=Shewanella piezotolerans (strain WP3 / JCM 13877) TaxID=225849 RepID=B8CU19_SHEPW|nr:hypothetical protein [Shewanella piezotolerans]ACJ30875.1 Conserved hypothetical protein [Shewanella piezotolerans WP3]